MLPLDMRRPLCYFEGTCLYSERARVPLRLCSHPLGAMIRLDFSQSSGLTMTLEQRHGNVYGFGYCSLDLVPLAVMAVGLSSSLFPEMRKHKVCPHSDLVPEPKPGH